MRYRRAPLGTGAGLELIEGLSIFKPPYSRLTAIDLNTRVMRVESGRLCVGRARRGDQAVGARPVGVLRLNLLVNQLGGLV